MAVPLTANTACWSAPRGQVEGPSQDSLAAVIRQMRAGEEAPGLAEAVAAAARIPPEHLGTELEVAMTRAVALSIGAEAIGAEDSCCATSAPNWRTPWP